MPFEPGHEHGVRFSADYQPDSNGRPKGVKNRSTIARKVLEMTALMPDDTFAQLKASFPNIEQRMTTEEIATLVMIGSAIAKKDVNAYKAIMDSAYGAPKQEVEHSGEMTNKTVAIEIVPPKPLDE